MEDSPEGVQVLPGGLTLQRVAPGLFEATLTRPDGVSSGLLDRCDLQQMVDALSSESHR